MILRHGDSGDGVKRLQRGLNQLGSILLVDGEFGDRARLQDRDPAVGDRREMRNIRDLLAAGDADAVAGELEAMTRLWTGKALPGLVQRRLDEAKLWRLGFAALQFD